MNINRDCNNSYAAFLLYLTTQSNLIENIVVSDIALQRLIATGNSNTSNVALDDLIAARNLFRLYDYVMKEPPQDVLTLDWIKHLHGKLMYGIDQYAPESIGRFKVLPNMVGNSETTAPEEVEKCLKELIDVWNDIEEPTLADIAYFHIAFEKIHPFDDGNGRIGRVIMLYQAITAGEKPFAISYDARAAYHDCFCCENGVEKLMNLIQRMQQELPEFY